MCNSLQLEMMTLTTSALKLLAWVLGACSDSDDGGGTRPQHPSQDEAELEEDEFERMFKGAKSRKRRGANDVVLRYHWRPMHRTQAALTSPSIAYSWTGVLVRLIQ